MTRTSRDLAEAAWPEVRGGLLVVPVGSVEQHGPHLPLDTDTRIAAALADYLARARRDAVLAPAVPYGASGEHEEFPGTVSAGSEGLAGYLIEVLRSASRTFDQVLLVNGHGGNTETLGHVVTGMRGEGRDVRLWEATWEGGDAHAGRTETSLLLALAPHLVRLDRAEAGNTAPLDELWPTLRVGGVRSASANGVLGDPAGASAEEGHALYRKLVSDLADAVGAWWP